MAKHLHTGIASPEKILSSFFIFGVYIIFVFIARVFLFLHITLVAEFLLADVTDKIQ